MKLPGRSVLLLLVFCCSFGYAQKALWQNFDTSLGDGDLKPMSALDAARQKALEEFVLSAGGDPDCRYEPERLSELSVGRPGVFLVTGECMQSESMDWLISWKGNHFTNLAAPRSLYCWFQRVQPHVSYGLHDFTMGCHQSSYATDFAWYRFDGRLYRRIGKACAYQWSTWNSPSLRMLRKKGWDAGVGCVVIPYSKGERDQR